MNSPIFFKTSRADGDKQTMENKKTMEKTKRKTADKLVIIMC